MLQFGDINSSMKMEIQLLTKFPLLAEHSKGYFTKNGVPFVVRS